MAFEAAAGILDPRFAVDAYSSRVRSLVFASLLEAGADGSYRPYLAERWKCDYARLRCVFELADGFVFHDGSPVTAADVAATYRSILDPASGSPKRAVLEPIADVEHQGLRSVQFNLKRASPTFLEATTFGVLPARLANTTGALGPDALVGAGPYRIVSHQADRILLQAFDRYPLGMARIASIEIRVVPDALMRAMELRHGSVDMVQNAVDPDTVEWLESNSPQLQVLRGPSSNSQYLGMNFAHPALARIEVRRAIACAIDREAVVEHLLGGQAQLASGLLPAAHWAYTDRVRRYRCDRRRAARLLDRAGYPDPDGAGPRPRIKLSYKTTTDELRRRIAEALAQQLGAVGIELEVLTYEWGTFFADVRSGNFDLYSLQWVGIVDPDLYRQVFHSAMIPPVGSNRGHYRNERMDRLTAHGASVTDRSERRRIYARVQRLAARQLPYVPMWWPERVVVASRRLAGFVPHPSGDLLGLASATLAPRDAARD